MSEETQGSDYLLFGASFYGTQTNEAFVSMRQSEDGSVLIHRFGHLIRFLLRIPLPIMHLTVTMHTLLRKGIRR